MKYVTPLVFFGFNLKSRFTWQNSACCGSPTDVHFRGWVGCHDWRISQVSECSEVSAALNLASEMLTVLFFWFRQGETPSEWKTTAPFITLAIFTSSVADLSPTSHHCWASSQKSALVAAQILVWRNNASRWSESRRSARELISQNTSEYEGHCFCSCSKTSHTPLIYIVQ